MNGSTTSTAPALPALRGLEALVGRWRLDAAMGGVPTGTGRTTFEWLPGGTFLLQRAEAEYGEVEPPAEWVANSPFPLTTVTGLDESTGTCAMLYADARGVLRVYQLSLRDGVWEMWRTEPGMHQRFTGTFSADRNTITAAWEASGDGTTWEHDFDLVYTRQ